jgi:F420-non-reducing hydrogenase small subunit
MSRNPRPATKKTLFHKDGSKLKVAFYWAAACGGCDLAVLEIGEKILKLLELVDIVFWPCIADFKYHHVKSYPDQHIDLCFFNGAIRTTDHREIAELLRKKSKRLVAYGSCAHEGSIPALANLHSRDETFSRIYLDNPSTHNPHGVLPQPQSGSNGHQLALPEYWNTVLTLDHVVDVDYTIPGCPPTEKMTWLALETLASAHPPEPGSIVGAGEKSVCDECSYEKKQERITTIHRPHLFVPSENDEQCLLEQGLVCLGPATRSGCEARCLQARMPCRGCYGPAPDVEDQGASMVAALGSILADEKEEGVREVINQVVDPIGTFYRFSLSKSKLLRKRSTSTTSEEEA